MISWKEEISVKSRFYFSMQHIQSAALFAKHSGQIENDSDGNISGEPLIEYWADITASIFAAVSFLEATINELFANATEKYSGFPQNINLEIKTLMAEMWNKRVPRTAHYSVLEKFDIALILAHKPAFDRGKPPVKDVDLVIKLRNSLIHYEPEWMGDEIAVSSTASTEKKLYKDLRGKFPISPLWAGKNYNFFPNKCLNYGCARWAVESSIIYADEFYSKLGSVPPKDSLYARFYPDSIFFVAPDVAFIFCPQQEGPLEAENWPQTSTLTCSPQTSQR